LPEDRATPKLVGMSDDSLLRESLRLQLADLNPRQRAQVMRAAGDVREVAHAPLPDALRASLLAVTDACVEAELRHARAARVEIVTRAHPGWPPLLEETADPPAALWVRGALPDPERLPLAIVGSRRPSSYGLVVTRRLSRDMASLGALVVSGGARGVDGVAHDAALESGAPTLAVLGCGVDVAYPPEHARLFGQIGGHGAVVSEHSLGTTPRKHHFPARNRLLAGWCHAVLVTEASRVSGALITARLALELGREVLAVPGPINSRSSEGTNDLIARGARMLRGAADLVAELRADQRARLLPLESIRREPGGGDVVLASLAPGESAELDALVARTGLATGPLLARLIALELRGEMRSLAGGSWLRT
jgi:DNA processing protein